MQRADWIGDGGGEGVTAAIPGIVFPLVIVRPIVSVCLQVCVVQYYVPKSNPEGVH